MLSTDLSPEAIFRLVEKHRVTHIHVVPALLIRWLADPAIARFDLSSLRFIQSGGQRLQPEIRSRCEELIPTVTVQENFGMAEGMLMFVRLDDPEDVRLETVGRPVCPDDEIMLLDDDDNIVPFGEIGEFCCRGPYTLRGYYAAAEHNKRAFTPDGFYRSGDLMRQHPSGNYMVEGRKKDLINRGGEKISAEEIENLILGHPRRAERRLRAMPDPDLGERMCACVVLRPGGTLVLRRTGRLPAEPRRWRGIKLPERLVILEELPLSNFGKVSKKNTLGNGDNVCCRTQEGSGKLMRKIDLHSYPGTQEWIACQGPYVEALAAYWNRDVEGQSRSRRRLPSSRRRASKPCWSRWTSRQPSAPRPAATNTSTGLQRPPSTAIIQAWAAVEPFKGVPRSRRPTRRSASSGCWDSTSIRSCGTSASTRLRLLPVVRRDQTP